MMRGVYEQKNCKCGCGTDISHKHLNAKFCNKRHKDDFWNRVNPRGHGKISDEDEDYDPGDDEYWLSKDWG